VEEEIRGLMKKSKALQRDLLRLIERDALVFAPLAKAYGMPKDTEEQKMEKERVMEAALKVACSVPLEIMEKCCEGIELVKIYAEKGSVMAVSDAGVAAAFLEGALKGASLNVYINTKSMADRALAAELNAKCDRMLEEYSGKADAIFDNVLGRLKK
jgi:formiminotetrahydrofolate cyclodeaminase